MTKSAIISDCNKYRYELHREWDKDKGKVLFVMLNPSTADADNNDLTTIRCMNFAKKWGYGGIMIGNIYPFRAKRPKDLRKWLKNHGDLYDFNVFYGGTQFNADGGDQYISLISLDASKNANVHISERV